MPAMTGQERSAERRIRLWIVQQERNRRKAGQMARTAARGDAQAPRRQGTAAARQHKSWQ